MFDLENLTRARSLIENGANVNAVDRSGWAPLNVASEFGIQ